MDSQRTSRLLIIGTPIGNLEDLTPRARRTLSELSHLMAEDTRETRRLLELVGIPLEGKTLHSYATHNMKAATEFAIRLLEKGESVGLVSDRGMPGISDPGALLVKAASEAGFPVVPIPGVSSVTTALSVCGVEASEFLFLGFVPTQSSSKKEFFERLALSQHPVCFFEAPHRIAKTLIDIKAELPHGSLLIARELSKQFETITWTSLSSLDVSSIPELGEFTLVFFQDTPRSTQPTALDEWVTLRLKSDKDWAKAAGQALGVAANEAYNALQRARSQSAT
ncbi:MAG: 16S rRNA (cytidine(1402)-2'-O)-methyltransferase [Deltaproteobacteria bacterium]|nr:16S rRNA (cytidine(1402)-2'-O)-methyltransferase [Deltaproteobacteria bacterium]MBI3296056.1 16S rRNA (cytidine(1402)-2'-O)-methyltransferase [Deltaproteobacteria bacterium]